MDTQLAEEFTNHLGDLDSRDLSISLRLCECLGDPSDFPVVSTIPRGTRLSWERGCKKLSLDISSGKGDWFYRDPVNGNLESGEAYNPEVFSTTVLGGFLECGE